MIVEKFSKGFFLSHFIFAALLFTACTSSCEKKSDFGKTELTVVTFDENAPLDFIFNNQTLGSTCVTIKRSEWNKLCDNYRFFYRNENYVRAQSCTYEKDGKSWSLENVGFRLRGNTSRNCPQGVDNGREQGQRSAEWIPWYFDYAEKPNDDYRQSHFKISFGEFSEKGQDKKLAGCLKGLALKRLDHSLGREIFCYDLFRKYGIWTAPRASHTRLEIDIIEDNGDGSVTKIDYGVYEMFEEVDSQSLSDRKTGRNKAENAWGSDKGNLWKCGFYGTASAASLTNPSGNGMGVEKNLIVFDDDGNPVDKIYESYDMDLKTNKKNFEKAREELCSFIRELNGLPKVKGKDASEDKDAIKTIKSFYEKWLDVDFFLKTYAVNILCGMDDDYWASANNYYLYFDTRGEGSTGRVYLIPFDYDNSLGCSIHEGGFRQDPLYWGRGQNRPLMDRLLSVPEYKTKFKKYLREVSSEKSLWNFERCSSQFKSWADMLKPYVRSPDLVYSGVGVQSFEDYTWQPEGYSLVHREKNIYDATRKSINGWLCGKKEE